MKPLTVALVVALAPACSHPPEATSARGFEVAPSCDAAYYELQLFSPPSEGRAATFVTAHATAHQHHGQAKASITAKRPADAATEWLACAHAYDGIPDGDPQRGLAQDSAVLCTKNAALAFGSAGKFASDGKAALEKLAADEPRLATVVHDALANPPYDCAHPAN
ncbi:MAG: hypothetical protein NT062_19925 [Proteobacteria bacterium]|nr:hypothetical protein [Pseudomonadota bacterium]